MKVTCVKNISDFETISNDNHFSLTVGKEYDADIKVINHNEFYYIRNDLGNKNIYGKSYFVTKGEIRNQKLEEFGI